MKIKIFFFIILLLFFIPLTHDSFACSCASEIDYDKTLAEADSAFKGTVIKLEDGSGFQKVHFMIHSVQKGDLEEGYFIMTNVNLYFDENKTGMSNSCDPDYTKGNTYQVFGWGSTEQNPVGETNMCSTRVVGTTIVSEISDEILCLGYRGGEVDENCNIIRPSPYKQQLAGTEPEDVRCNHDLYRSYKTSDGTAFCASGYTLRELIHRGYAEPFDSINSSTVSGQNTTVNEYCPSSQKLLQSGWYAYENPTDVTVSNIDLVYDSEEDSRGVEYTFYKMSQGKSMVWVFVECGDSSKSAYLAPEITPRYEKYLDENNELNFGLLYDKDGMIIDDLQRIFDWCDYTGGKPAGWYFDWNNQTHHIDSKNCEWTENEN